MQSDKNWCNQFKGLGDWYITTHTIQAEAIFSGENVNTSAALALVENLTKITVPDQEVTVSLFPSDLNTTNFILMGAVDSLLVELNKTGKSDSRQVWYTLLLC